MRLNKYVIKIPYKNKIILYNTFNDMIVLCEYKDFFNKQLKNELLDNDFYSSSKKLLNDYLKNRAKNRSQLDITISLTESCNLCCKYCSQAGVKRNTFISKETINQIVDYISICKRKYGYKSVSIHLFGGEPLLMKNEIYYLNSQLKSKRINANYYMDTNGLLIDKDFIKKIDNITFCITISNKEDHDSLIVTKNNKATYNIIMNNIKNIQDCLDKNHKLMLRYNVNHNNVSAFEDFLKTISNLNIYYITIAYTNNYLENVKTNFLSYKAYKKWYSSKAIELLFKYGYPVELPTSSYYCKGYDKYSLKVFSDGKLGMCNAYDIKKANLTINELLELHKLTNKLPEPFYEERKLEKVIDKKCIKCKFLFICNGKYYCRDKKCEFTDYNLVKYIKSYVKYYLNK